MKKNCLTIFLLLCCVEVRLFAENTEICEASARLPDLPRAVKKLSELGRRARDFSYAATRFKMRPASDVEATIIDINGLPEPLQSDIRVTGSVLKSPSRLVTYCKAAACILAPFAATYLSGAALLSTPADAGPLLVEVMNRTDAFLIFSFTGAGVFALVKVFEANALENKAASHVFFVDGPQGKADLISQLEHMPKQKIPD